MLTMRMKHIFVILLIVTTVAITACGSAQYTGSTQYSLSTSVNPSGAGTVSPAGGTYDAGTEVTLTATLAQGYVFDRWSGDATGTSSSINLTMDSSKSVVAHFKAYVEGGILFRDDFVDNRNNWRITRSTSDTERFIEDGALHIVLHKLEGHVGMVEHFRWPPSAPDFADFGLEVDVRVVQAEDKWARGLVFLYNADTDVRYHFVITGNGAYQLARAEDNERTSIITWTESPYIQVGNASNKLRVICRNSVIELYVNGHLLERVSGEFPSDIGGNGIGLFVSGVDGTHITFDNIKMWVVTP